MFLTAEDAEDAEIPALHGVLCDLIFPAAGGRFRIQSRPQTQTLRWNAQKVS
jgi:hypothetical protein